MANQSRSVPRKKPRQERSRATVDAILEAAARVLVDSGYEATSTRRVAELAGVSIGSLYQYFPSKEALVMALAERQLQRVLEVCTEVLRPQEGLPVREAARRVALGVTKVYAVNPRLYQVLVSEGLKLGIMERVHSLEQRMDAAVRSFLLSNQDILRPQRVELATFVVMRAVRGVMWAAATEQPSLFEDPALVDELSELILGYLHR